MDSSANVVAVTPEVVAVVDVVPVVPEVAVAPVVAAAVSALDKNV